MRGEVDAAEEACVRTLLVSIRLHHEEGIAYGLEGLCAVAAARGDGERAGTLSAAAAVIRHRIGVFDAEAFRVHTPQLDAIRAEPIRMRSRPGERRGARADGRRGDRRSRCPRRTIDALRAVARRVVSPG